MRFTDAQHDLHLAGAPNFRDIGGCSAAGGLRLRRRQLFRSDDLSRLTGQDVAVLRELRIRVVVDLRTESERRRRPSRLPETGFELLSVGTQHIAGTSGTLRGFRDMLTKDPSVAGARCMMIETYRSLPLQCALAVGCVIHRLVEGASPLLIHCTLGKDRTGFVCACLHRLLGVPEEQIYEDYLRSGEIHFQRTSADREVMLAATSQAVEDMIGVSVSRDVIEVIGSVDREYLSTAFSVLDQEFGSIEGYVKSCGVDWHVIDRLRERLLV